MKKTILDYKLGGKKVIIRADLNVPMKDGVITDDTRIRESVETIRFALVCEAKVIIMSHLGRVETEEDKKNNSLAIVCGRLKELLNYPITFVPHTRGKDVEDAISKLKVGEAIMLENTRFEDVDGKKESSNDPELGKYWASLGEVFINDAFGTAHRKHASNVGIASYLPSGIGFLVKKEVEALSKALEKPKRPFVVILGGAKVRDKIGVIRHMAEVADSILIGGGMAFTFLKAQGHKVGCSLVDDANIDFCKEMLEKYKDKIKLPVDVQTGTSMIPSTTVRLTTVDQIYDNEMGLDIGVETINQFKTILLDAKTVFWNGPLGAFELDIFQQGTRKIMQIVQGLRATTIIGGGDTAAAAIKFGYGKNFTHISTGGGASLEFMEGKELPGLTAISNR